MRYLLLGAAAVLACGCGKRNVGGPPRDPGPAPARTVETFADQTQVVAGTTVTLTCVVREEGTELPDEPSTLRVSPDAGVISGTGTVFTISPAAVGLYTARCESGGAVDDQGVLVEVVADAPNWVETTLSFPTSMAGAANGVSCAVFDSYGNAVEDADDYGLDHDAELLMDPAAEGSNSFVFRGTTMGDYSVACRHGNIVDDTPAMVTILEGFPSASETTLSSTNLLPTETATVSCTYTDAYGNPVTVAASDGGYYVLADSGASAADSGLVESGASFSLTTAGLYFVACSANGYLAGDDTPVEVIVSPGLPHHTVSELPTQDCFWEDTGLPLFYEAYDAWDNLIAPSQYTLSVSSTPSGATIDSEGIIQIPGEGDFDITVDVSSPQASDSIITPFVANLRIDSTPPVFSGMTPARSAILSQGGLSASNVDIDGTVSDSVSYITDVSVLGSAKTVSGTSLSEGFTHVQSSSWGINVITGTAVDECGNRRVMAQSYMRSHGTDGYFPANTAASSSSGADRGIVAHLNQEVIDDGVRGTALNPDADDLATIAWLAILGTDLDAVIPNPIAGDGLNKRTCNCGFWTVSNVCNETDYLVTKTGTLTYDDPRIDYLNAIDDGLRAGLAIEDLNLPLRVEGCVDVGCVVGCTGIRGSASVSGTVSVTGEAFMDAVLDMSLVGGVPSAAASTSASFTCPGLGSCPWVDIDWGILSDIGLGGLLNDILNDILGVFMNGIINVLEDEVDNAIAPLIEDFLASFSLDTGFTLPAPLNLDINMSSGLDHMEFSGPEGSGYAQLGLETQLFPDSHHTDASSNGDVIPPTAGAIRKDNVSGGGPLPSFSSSYAFGLGAKDDVLNQLLWALWYGGGLDLSLSEIGDLIGGGFDLDGIDLEMYATLPPVIQTGTGSNMVDIGVGDMFVSATVDLATLLGAEASGVPPLSVDMYLSATMGGVLDVTSAGDELLLCLANADDPRCPAGLPAPAVYVEVVSIDDEGYQAVMTDLFRQVFTLLLPQLLGSVASSFPIPEFDLSAIANLPTGAPVVLQLNNASLDKPDDQHIRLTGDLQ